MDLSGLELQSNSTYMRFLLSNCCVVFVGLASVLLTSAKDLKDSPEQKAIPGSQPLERATLGVSIANNRDVAISLKVIVNEKDKLVITLGPGESCYIYSFSDVKIAKQNIQYSYKSKDGNDRGRCLYATLVLNNGQQNPMGWSQDAFQLPEMQRGNLFSKDFRYSALNTVDIEEGK